jgi:hypothetical protein
MNPLYLSSERAGEVISRIDEIFHSFIQGENRPAILRSLAQFECKHVLTGEEDVSSVFRKRACLFESVSDLNFTGPAFSSNGVLCAGIFLKFLRDDPEWLNSVPFLLALKMMGAKVSIFYFDADPRFSLSTLCEGSIDLIQLSGEYYADLATSRSFELDLAIFGSDVSSKCHTISLLCCSRVANKQVLTSATLHDPFFSQVDYILLPGKAEVSPAIVSGCTATIYFESPGVVPNVAATGLAPPRAGLAGRRDIFCGVAFNKYSRRLVAILKSLLDRLPDARLYLAPFAPHYRFDVERCSALLREELSSSLADSRRLVIAGGPLGHRGFLDMASGCLLGIDAVPVSGSTTIIDCLQAGTPVVAYCGRQYRNRYGSIVNSYFGLEDFNAMSDLEIIDLYVSSYTAQRSFQRDVGVVARDISSGAVMTRVVDSIQGVLSSAVLK